MSNKNEKGLKKCRVCGKTITDKNNKTGLCPEHQDKGKTIIGGLGAIVLSVGTAFLVKVLKKR